jgi:hypothetical protein
MNKGPYGLHKTLKLPFYVKYAVFSSGQHIADWQKPSGYVEFKD